MKTSNRMMAATLLGAIVAFGLVGSAYAQSISVSGGSGTDHWTTETGQSIPTGTQGTLDGTVAVTAGDYTFTYGGFGPNGLPLLGGETGHGDSVYTNEFWVGSSYSSAKALGDIFCNHPDGDCPGGAATAIGSEFELALTTGNIQFGFTFGPTTSNVIVNGETDNNNDGAYLAQVGTGTSVSTGPDTIAYLGLSDSPYSADHDFQDMDVTISVSPEPGSVLLMGAGLIGVAFFARRRKKIAA